MSFVVICFLSLAVFANAGDGNIATVVTLNVATKVAASTAKTPTKSMKTRRNVNAVKNGKVSVLGGVQDRSLGAKVAFSSIGYSVPEIPQGLGIGLDFNLNRVRCANHGQCRFDEYCYSCSKCTGGCASCKVSAVSVSGFCGPIWRCLVDNDSITQTCPIFAPAPTYPARSPVFPIPLVTAAAVRQPPVNSCNYQLCNSCTAFLGCVWSGNQCLYSTATCNIPGCANTPAQCRSIAPVVPVSTSCAFNNCQNCVGAQGCAWSGSFCYYTLAPCNTPGCANTATQCPECTSNSQCGIGRICEKGACLTSDADQRCGFYTCSDCVLGGCFWDPWELFIKCKPECDSTDAGLGARGPATACVTNFDFCENLDNRDTCTKHDQCPNGYCFGCSKCHGDCFPCFRHGVAVFGVCAPASACPFELDSIDGLCPVV